jgi:hypothetical protein
MAAYTSSKRRRGGQLGNQKALNHGFYAVKRFPFIPSEASFLTLNSQTGRDLICQSMRSVFTLAEPRAYPDVVDLLRAAPLPYSNRCFLAAGCSPAASFLFVFSRNEYSITSPLPRGIERDSPHLPSSVLRLNPAYLRVTRRFHPYLGVPAVVPNPKSALRNWICSSSFFRGTNRPNWKASCH